MSITSYDKVVHRIKLSIDYKRAVYTIDAMSYGLLILTM